MDILKITEKVNQIAKSNDLELFSIKQKKEHGLQILEILLDGKLNSNNIEVIHNLILDDINDDLPDDYYLEVSSVGAERPIRNEEEMKKYVGHYINISSDFYKGDCTLVSYSDGILTIKANFKGRLKSIEIPYQKINNARLAIKF